MGRIGSADAGKFIKKTLVQFLDPEEYRMFIFGSRANGKVGKFSDYDVGIFGKKSLPLHLLSLIKEAFEESDFPFRVDVVDFSLTSTKFRKIALVQTKEL